MQGDYFMKTAILEKVKKLTIKDLPIPEILENEVLVKIKEVGLCGSDIHYYNEGRIGDFIVKKPIILGHESSGIISGVGKNIKGFKIGDKVSIEPGVPCYKCDYCKTGKYHLCTNMAFMATPPFDGAFAEYIKYDPNFLFKISDNVSFTEAALAEPLSVGYNCTTRADVKAGDYVCILGCGPIGLACLEISKIMGASKIFITDINDYRLNIAKKHGAFRTINILREDLPKIINECTENLGVDSVIEASGNEASLINSLKIVKKGGKVVWVGMGKDNITVPYASIISKDISIEGIFRYKNTYKLIIRLLESKKINLEGWVSHRFKFDEIQKAFDIANDHMVNKMKIIIEI